MYLKKAGIFLVAVMSIILLNAGAIFAEENPFRFTAVKNEETVVVNIRMDNCEMNAFGLTLHYDDSVLELDSKNQGYRYTEEFRDTYCKKGTALVNGKENRILFAGVNADKKGAVFGGDFAIVSFKVKEAADDVLESEIRLEITSLTIADNSIKLDEGSRVLKQTVLLGQTTLHPADMVQKPAENTVPVEGNQHLDDQEQIMPSTQTQTAPSGQTQTATNGQTQTVPSGHPESQSSQQTQSALNGQTDKQEKNQSGEQSEKQFESEAGRESNEQKASSEKSTEKKADMIIILVIIVSVLLVISITGYVVLKRIRAGRKGN